MGNQKIFPSAKLKGEDFAEYLSELLELEVTRSDIYNDKKKKVFKPHQTPLIKSPVDDRGNFNQCRRIDVNCHAMTMKFIEEHQLLLKQVFENEIPEDLDLSNSADHSDLEELNPSDAVEVAEFSAEVENWTTWKQESYFYVCKVPKLRDTYLLFAIHWDDNWEHWERQSWDAVEGMDTHESAAAVLLHHFADEHLENAGDGEWKEFLKGLKQ